MASEQVPLLFFQPQPDADPLVVAKDILIEAPLPKVISLDPLAIMQRVQATRGFARLKVALPHFTLDNPQAGAALNGIVLPTHIRVGFYGNVDKLAERFLSALTATGLACYSVWDKAMIPQWPKWEEPFIDRGYAERMTRILQRMTAELRETEPDEKRRSQALNAFVDSPDFRAEMAREARREPSRGKKTYDDVVNCYVRWKDGRASVTELGAVRKLDPKLAAMTLPDLCKQVGDAPRFLLAIAVPPRRAAQLRYLAEELGLSIESERP